MKYLSIPGIVLSSKKLDGDEKLLVAYIYNWERVGQKCAKAISYMEKALGINDIDPVLMRLLQKQIIFENNLEFYLAPKLRDDIEKYILEGKNKWQE